MIWVRLKSNPSITKFIHESDFDPNDMEKMDNEELEKNKVLGKARIQEMVESGRAPGLPSKDSEGKSMYYKGKLDDGATAEFLDRGLSGAKKRANERNNKVGSSFKKIKNVGLRRKK